MVIFRAVEIFYYFFNGKGYLLYFKHCGLNNMSSYIFYYFGDVLIGMFFDVFQLFMQISAFSDKKINRFKCDVIMRDLCYIHHSCCI